MTPAAVIFGVLEAGPYDGMEREISLTPAAFLVTPCEGCLIRSRGADCHLVQWRVLAPDQFDAANLPPFCALYRLRTIEDRSASRLAHYVYAEVDEAPAAFDVDLVGLARPIPDRVLEEVGS